MKTVVGIFAHPDDEVFGPGGTLATLAEDGTAVYLICVTDGDAGQNSSSEDRSLGEIRREELLASAKELGVLEVFFLGYKDGTLCNELYHEIAGKIQTIVQAINPERILTMESRGVSGHLDHIAVSMIASYIFEHTDTIDEIWYYALTEHARSFQLPYFIYFPPGYPPSAISKTVSIENVWDKKVSAMRKHVSQSHDMERLLGNFMKRPKEEYFIVMTREDLDNIRNK